jgi:hypothetical protein
MLMSRKVEMCRWCSPRSLSLNSGEHRVFAVFDKSSAKTLASLSVVSSNEALKKSAVYD